MAQPNYAFAKRQRDLAKQQKKKDKALRKASGEPAPADEQEPQPDQEQTAAEPSNDVNTAQSKTTAS